MPLREWRDGRDAGLVAALTLVALVAIAVVKFSQVPGREADLAMRAELARVLEAESRFDDSASYQVYGRLGIRGHMAGVIVPVVTVSDSGSGWSARVTSLTTGAQCAVAVDMPNPIDRARPSGDIACQ